MRNTSTQNGFSQLNERRSLRTLRRRRGQKLSRLLQGLSSLSTDNPVSRLEPSGRAGGRKRATVEPSVLERCRSLKNIKYTIIICAHRIARFVFRMYFNVFNNINHPKGMAARAEVEEEIDKAKAKVRERVGMPDVLDGM